MMIKDQGASFYMTPSIKGDALVMRPTSLRSTEWEVVSFRFIILKLLDWSRKFNEIGHIPKVMKSKCCKSTN